MRDLQETGTCPIHKKAKERICHNCGLREAPDKPMQNARIIGFSKGVKELGLTPDFLDGDENIVTTHRGECNNSSELSLNESIRRLVVLGYREPPDFLPGEVKAEWKSAATPLQ